MDFRHLERRIIVGSRFMTLIAVAGSLAGALLMFLLGLHNIWQAFAEGLRYDGDEPGLFGTAAIISVIEGLDRFLIGIVLLYFTYGVHTLFIHPGEPKEEFALPKWLRVQGIGQLKQVVAEVIVVILLVLFLRVTLQAFHGSEPDLTWREIGTLALLPFSVLLLAIALRVIELHPKPGRPARKPEDDA